MLVIVPVRRRRGVHRALPTSLRVTFGGPSTRVGGMPSAASVIAIDLPASSTARANAPIASIVSGITIAWGGDRFALPAAQDYV